MSTAADRYLTDRVTTASPAELTAMLYDAAVGAVRHAGRLLDDGNRLGALPRLLKAQEIVLELRMTLDHAAGPLAGQLDGLYGYCYQRLLDAVVRRDRSGLTDALTVLEPLQSAWRTSCLQLAA